MSDTFNYPVNEVRRDYIRQIYEAREKAEWNGFSRMIEKQMIEAVVSGNKAQVTEYLGIQMESDHPVQIGRMSENPIHQARYYLVATVTMVTRGCIDAGLPERLAFSISDAFIRNADTSNSVESIINLTRECLYEFCQNMADWRLKGCSLPVRLCCEYILEHLHDKISLEQLGEACGRSPHHVSDMFCRDLGLRPMEFIRKEKLRQAHQALDNLELTIANISELFSFASPSAFSKQFSDEYGITPLEYRKSRLY